LKIVSIKIVTRAIFNSKNNIKNAGISGVSIISYLLAIQINIYKQLKTTQPFAQPYTLTYPVASVVPIFLLRQFYCLQSSIRMAKKALRPIKGTV
jgi:hypothetical protein